MARPTRSKSALGRALLLPLTGLLAVAALPPPEIVAKHRALETAVAREDHPRVLELATELTGVQPQNPSLWYALGRSAFSLDRHELAIEASRRAWDLGARHMPWIALRIARSSAALDRDEEAFEWIQRALASGFEDRRRLTEYDELEKYLSEPRFRSLAGLDAPEDRTAGLRADIDFLVAEARRVHPEYPRRAPAFEEAARSLKRRIPELSDREFLFHAMRLVALLEDGHSVVYGPMESSPLDTPSGTLPVLFYLFDEGLYVVDAKDEASDLVGMKVLRIGRRTPDELLEHSRTLRGADNSMTMRWLGPRFYFPRIGFLLDAGAVDDPDRVSLEVSDESGEAKRMTLLPGGHRFPRKLRPPKSGDAETPRYLERVDTNYWLETLRDRRAVYFQFNQVREAEDESIAAFADRLGETLAAREIESLIVDLRHNNGGNNGLLRPLLRRIVAFDTRPGTRIFVLTGRNTFSAAQNFVSRLERWTDSLFVGEPSSSSPNFVGEDTRVVLPWSRILVSVSSRFWQESDPGDERPWIAPDLPVPVRAADYFGGRDAALDAIFAVLPPEDADPGPDGHRRPGPE